MNWYRDIYEIIVEANQCIDYIEECLEEGKFKWVIRGRKKKKKKVCPGKQVSKRTSGGAYKCKPMKGIERAKRKRALKKAGIAKKSKQKIVTRKTKKSRKRGSVMGLYNRKR